jgi:hypothetical protein
VIDYLTLNGTDAQFDTNEFLKVQHEIALKYDNPYTYRIPKYGLVHMAKRMDNFYARINGEIAEVYRELERMNLMLLSLSKNLLISSCI